MSNEDNKGVEPTASHENAEKRKDLRNKALLSFVNPAFLVIISILIAIFVLIASNLNTLLLNLAKKDFARGLITYLFAVGTIGCMAVILSYVFTAKSNFDEKRASFAKDIFSILIGIFGTIVGYYYGSETNTLKPSFREDLKVSKIGRVIPDSDSTKFYAYQVNGGSYPYCYKVKLNDKLFDEGYVDGIILVREDKLNASVKYLKIEVRDINGTEYSFCDSLFKK